MKSGVNVLTWVDITTNELQWAGVNKTSRTWSGIPVDLDQIPPFQQPVPKNYLRPSAFSVVNIETGVETDILAEIEAAGLALLVDDSTKYDIIMWRGNIKLGVFTEPGCYYALMTVGVRTYKSVYFTMFGSVSSLYKLEWCHRSRFDYSGGYVQYQPPGFPNLHNGFKYYLYCNAELGFPQWPTTREAPERDGVKQNLKQIRKKSWEFEFHAPEHIIDAFSGMSLHDEKKLYTPDGQELDISEVNFEVDWVRRGWGMIRAELLTDELIIVVNGRGSSAGVCEVTPGGCVLALGVDYYTAESELQVGGMDWVAGTYYDSTGTQQNLVAGELVMAGGPGSRYLYEFNAPNDYTQLSLVGATASYIWVENTDEYWYHKGIGGGQIDQSSINGFTDLTDPWTFYGDIHPGMIGEIWLERTDGTTFFVKKTDPTSIDLGEEVPGADASNIVAVILKTGTVLCGMHQEHRFQLPDNFFVFADDDYADASTALEILADDDYADINTAGTILSSDDKNDITI